MELRNPFFSLIVNLAHRVQNSSPVPAVYWTVAFPPQQCNTYRPLAGYVAAGDWSLGFSWLYLSLLHSSGKSVLLFQFKSVYEVPDARCVCAQVSILLLTAP